MTATPDRKVRVLHVINGVEVGGAERLLLSMAPLWDSSRFDVRYLNLFFGEGAFIEALSRDYPVDIVEGRTMAALPRLIAASARIMRREAIDIVHTHLLHSTIAGCFAAKLAGVPAQVVTRHYTEEGHHGKSRLIVAADNFTTGAATHVIAVSSAVRERLIAAGVRSERISIVWNGIDVSAIDAARPAILRRSTAGSPFTAVAVGSLQPRKDHATALRALALARRSVDVRLIIVGEGPERESLVKLAAELGIADAVCFVGYRDDVYRILWESDVYIQPSRWESFGIAVLEALATELPVIAARVGGIPDIIESERNGILVEPGDEAALAHQLVRLASEPLLRRSLGEAGRSVVSERFAVARIVRDYQELYTRLAAQSDR